MRSRVYTAVVTLDAATAIWHEDRGKQEGPGEPSPAGEFNEYQHHGVYGAKDASPLMSCEEDLVTEYAGRLASGKLTGAVSPLYCDLGTGRCSWDMLQPFEQRAPSDQSFGDVSVDSGDGPGRCSADGCK